MYIYICIYIYIYIYKFSNSQPDKLKSGIKKGTKVTLKLLSNIFDDSNDENNFPYKLLLTNTQISRLCKALQIIL